MKVISNSEKLFANGSPLWTHPMVEYLEQIKEHIAIYWAIEITELYIQSSGHYLTNTWLNWVNLLKQSLEIKALTIDQFQTLSNNIFHATPTRMIYNIVISNLYVAECSYQQKNLNKYFKHLEAVFNILSIEFNDDLNNGHTKIIKLFMEYTKNLPISPSV